MHLALKSDIIGGTKCIVAHPAKILGGLWTHPAHAAAPPMD